MPEEKITIEQERGSIFHIIHGSFVDGYGIRTTVFLKGCPLMCLWCCNPEVVQAYHPELKVTASLCDGCGRCIPACPTGAISLDDGGLAVDRYKCNDCDRCLDVCYIGALDCFGKSMTVDEVFDIVRRTSPTTMLRGRDHHRGRRADRPAPLHSCPVP